MGTPTQAVVSPMCSTLRLLSSQGSDIENGCGLSRKAVYLRAVAHDSVSYPVVLSVDGPPASAWTLGGAMVLLVDRPQGSVSNLGGAHVSS